MRMVAYPNLCFTRVGTGEHTTTFISRYILNEGTEPSNTSRKCKMFRILIFTIRGELMFFYSKMQKPNA